MDTQLTTNSASSNGSGLTQTSNSNAASDAAATNAIDFDNFLQLLTAQLENQDPLAPAESTEFVSQLASFSSVEQLVSVNDTLEEIASAIAGDAIDQYSSWIGRAVEMEPGPFNYTGEPVSFTYDDVAVVGADRLEAVVKDENGAEVQRFDVDAANPIFTWDGGTSSGPAGDGIYDVDVIAYNGDTISNVIDAGLTASVSEVRLGSNGATLNLDNGASVNPSSVVAIIDQSRIEPVSATE